MSIKDDIISIKNGLVTLGTALENLSVHASADEQIVNSNKSINFAGTEKNSIYGKGLQWSGYGNTKMLNFQKDPDRLWSSNTIDLHRDAHYSIDNTPVLTSEELGPSVRTSSLRKVGVLNGLAVNGNVNIDQFVFWNSGMSTLGIGIEQGNGQLSVASNSVEFIVHPNEDSVQLGSWTTHDLKLQTDGTDRVVIKRNGDVEIGQKGSTDRKVNIHGKLGLGVSNISNDVQLDVAGTVKFTGKKFEVGDQVPESGAYSQGDIVWNSVPSPGGIVGWICVKTGEPGQWKSFGNISQ